MATSHAILGGKVHLYQRGDSESATCVSALKIGSDSGVDGPVNARAKLRILTGGSIAIICSAFRRGVMTAGPDGFRDPVPNKVAAFYSR